jgi:acetate---CoA ligase (ADP-forming)
MSKKPDIKYLFEPRSVAVIGASHEPAKIGFKVLENIIKGGFKGRIYPINPKGGEIMGLKVYKSINEVPGEIDIADICIPAKYVFDSVKECADAGVKFAPIITSGFSEIGNIEEEKKIVRYAKSRGMRVLGPNIFGVYSSVCSLNATFGPDRILPGGVAIITQSGALGLSMIGKTAVESMGLSAIVSVGNKADVSESELLEYLMAQKETRTILMYIEGVRKGEEMVRILKKATKRKPVIVIKSGRSKRGAIAVASHTGSLAGSDKVFDDIMRQCGALRAESIEDAFNWCKFFDTSSLPKGKNCVIITNGGGIGVMAADACEKYGIELYDDSSKLKKLFSRATPDFGSTKNPIDVTGGATSKEYELALSAALSSKDIDSVIALYCETAVFDAENLSRLIERNYRSYLKGGKPLVFSIFGGEAIERSIDDLRRKGVPVFDDVYQGVSCLGAMETYCNYIRNRAEKHAELPMDTNSIEDIASKALSDGRDFLLADECREVMRVAGVTTPKSKIAESIDQAVKFAREIGYPVVMKVVSKDILHKSDVGGVILGLESDREIIDAYQAIISSCKSHKPNAVIKGVEIAEMIKAGTEIIVGARKDAKFGPTIMCGMGGIYVEVMKDIAFRSVPLDRNEIISMIKEIKSYQILLGVRGEDKKDINALVDTIIRVASIIRRCKLISDIEINPVAVYEQGKGVRAVDVRVLLSKGSKTKGENEDG